MSTAIQARNVYIAPTTPFNMSRVALVQWVSDLSGERYTKVEELCTGVAYCVIFQKMFPGTVSMTKVKTDAKTEVQRIDNLKVLQQAFNKVQCDKIIPVDRLVKGKLQDNLEFLQWFKLFCDANYGGQENFEPSPLPSAKSMPARTTMTKAVRRPEHSPARFAASSTWAPVPASAPVATSSGVVNDLKQQIQELKEQLAMKEAEAEEKNSILSTLERERDFYFNKLLHVEVLCQADENAELEISKKITEILYATEEGYEAPTAAAAPTPEVEDEELTF